MGANETQILFVGGGLANTLMAYRLRCLRPDVTFKILEASGRLGGEHTWSFHETDLNPSELSWIHPFVANKWSHYDVFFPKYQRQFPLTYASVRSGTKVPHALDFHRRMMDAIGDSVQFGIPAVHLNKNQVILADGTSHHAALVVDGRGPQETGTSLLKTAGFQKFLGLVLQTARPHGIKAPIVMDTRVGQTEGFHFIYVLPFSETTLLVEDTYYNMSPVLNQTQMVGQIYSYAQKHLGLSETQILDEEQGVLPIPLSFHPTYCSVSNQVVPSGLRAGLFHPTTSYSFGYAVSFADFFAKNWKSQDPDTSRQLILEAQKISWNRGSFFRRLNNMLFLAAPAEKRVDVFAHFYKKRQSLIENFYRGNLTLGDQLAILSGRPPVPISSGLKAFVGSFMGTKIGAKEAYAI